MTQKNDQERGPIKAWDVFLLIFLGGLLFGIVVAKHLQAPPPHGVSPAAGWNSQERHGP